jgi:tetratricopeptide (TPR) repeat protein
MVAARILLIVYVISGSAMACANITGTNIDGNGVSGGWGSYATVIRRSMDSSPEEWFRAITRNRNGKDDDEFTPQELKGVQNIYLGHHDEALGIFEEIESASPGRYNTAANMGTAFELKGNLDLALKWIAESMRRNPGSHQGTEWLHVAILKTKIRLKQDPGYLAREHIIGLPDNFTKASRITVDGQDYSWFEVTNALRYQLLERAVFVKPQDPVMADLLYTYGVLEAHVRTVESGIKLLELSREYGYPDRKRLDETIGHYEWLILFRKIRFGAWILAFLVFLVFAYRRKCFFLTRSAYRRHHASIGMS